MAGLSSRFTKAGYTLPKYMLYAGEKSLFNISVNSFKNYFDSVNFVFIARKLFDTELFIKKECILLGIKKYQTVMLDHPTNGQAETVMLGIKNANLDQDESILIFNIDTFRPNYSYPKDIFNWDGYLEVFKGQGANWSYAKTINSNSTVVIETAEKVEISDNCSTGLYYFKSVSSFLDIYNNIQTDSISHHKELYIAPLYNSLIKKGAQVHIHVIERKDVIFCGVPEEYLDFINKKQYLQGL